MNEYMTKEQKGLDVGWGQMVLSKEMFLLVTVGRFDITC